jgi:hypothetical protein
MHRRQLLGGVAGSALAGATHVSVPAAFAAEASAPTVATVTLNGVQHVYDRAAGTNIGSYSDPAGRFTMSCVRVSRSDCPLRADFRSIAGTNWSCIIFEYADWRTYLLNLPAYSVTIGNRVLEVPGHWSGARWRWQSGPWPFPLATTADLTAKKLLPRFNGALAFGTAGQLSAAGAYTPMSTGGFTGAMGMTGERADIGLVTGWQAEWLCTGRPAMLDTVLIQGEAAATFPLMWRDLQTNALIDAIVQYPRASPYWPNGGSPQLYRSPANGTMKLNFTGPPGTTIPSGVVMQFANPGRHELRLAANVAIPAGGSIIVDAANNGDSAEPTGAITFHPKTPVPGVTVTYVAGSFVAGSAIGLEGAHMPAMAYLPFLLTGDPYHLETLQAQAMFHIMEVPQQAGIIPDLPQQRAVAWMLRSLMQAATVTPATVPSWLLPQSIFKTGLDRVRTAMTSRTTDGWSGRFVHTLDSPGAADVAFWQADFLTAVIAWTTLLHAEWRPLLDWMLGCQQGRLDPTSGWCVGYPCSYWTKMGPTTWSALWAANQPVYRLTGCPTLAETLTKNTSYDYFSGLVAALRLAAQAGSTQASALLSTIAEPWQNGLTRRHGVTEYKWCVA